MVGYTSSWKHRLADVFYRVVWVGVIFSFLFKNFAVKLLGSPTPESEVRKIQGPRENQGPPTEGRFKSEGNLSAGEG